MTIKSKITFYVLLITGSYVYPMDQKEQEPLSLEQEYYRKRCGMKLASYAGPYGVPIAFDMKTIKASDELKNYKDYPLGMAMSLNEALLSSVCDKRREEADKNEHARY